MSDLGEALQPSMIEVSSPESVETPSVTTLTDVFHPEGMSQLAQKLTDSNGHCLVLVHPFYNFDGIESIDDIRDPAKKRYLENLKTALQKTQERNHTTGKDHRDLPILIFATNTGNTHYRSDENVQATSQKLTQQINDLLQTPGEYFFIFTDTDPNPVDSKRLPAQQVKQLLADHYDNSYIPLSEEAKGFVDFMLQLRQAGLTNAVVAGENFGTTHGLYFDGPYISADRPAMDGVFKVGNHAPDWLLRDHYFDRRKNTGNVRKHPLEIINPAGCVSMVARGLALSGVQTDISQITYPRKLPVTSQINQDFSISRRKKMSFADHPHQPNSTRIEPNPESGELI